MTQEELYAVLKTSGFPVAYYQWDPNVTINGVKGPPDPPYVIYLAARSNNFSADGKVYQKVEHYQVELYTKTKSPEAEEVLENALETAGIPWEKTETYIDSEKLYENLYEIEV